MKVRVRLFAAAREAAGEAIEVDVDGDPPTAGQVLEAIRRDARLAAIAARSRLAIGHAFASPDTPLAPGAEVALIPPVGGG